MRQALLLATVLLSALPVAGCDGAKPGIQGSEANRTPSPQAVSKEQVPTYKLAGVKDISFGGSRRFQARVSLPEHYSQAAVERVATAVVADITRSQPVNEISILFYGPGTSTAGAYDVAGVDWAPNGRWGSGNSVQAGNYSTFRYSVTYRPPSPKPPVGVAVLTKSNKTGLQGAPLPQGSKLLEKIAGSPDRDPSEEYSVPASAAQIAAFFSQALADAGWEKEGPSSETMMFFRRGTVKLGVLGNSKGGTFMLVGS